MADAKDPKLEMLKKFKDVSSWTKYFRRKQVVNPAPQVAAIRSLDKTNNTAVKTLKDLLTQQQKRPITFIKNDFRREKIDRKQIQQRIDSNSIAKETNRLMEDIRASLFNISNINEFDAKLNAIADSDLEDLLKLQRQLSIDQTKKNINGNAVKKIALTQERMYKVLEKIQDSLIVKQDIRSKKNNNININLVTGDSLGGSANLPGASGTPGQQDNGESFLTPFLEAALLMKNKGKIPTDVKNPSKWQKFLKSRYGKLAKWTALLGAVSYAAYKFFDDPEKAVKPLKNLFQDEVSNIRDLNTIDTTKLFNADGTFNGLWGLTNGLNLYSAIKRGESFIPTEKPKLTDLSSALSKNIDKDFYKQTQAYVDRVKRKTPKTLFGQEYKPKFVIEKSGVLYRKQFYPEDVMKPSMTAKLKRMPAMFKCLKSVGTVGTVLGVGFVASDIYAYWNTDIPSKIEKAKKILKQDNISPEVSEKIINNMRNANKWWTAEIAKSIGILTTNAVSTSGGPLAVITVVSITTVIDILWDFIRDLWIGYKFNLADFDNPYTFIDQVELAKQTSVSFVANVLDTKTLVDELKKSNAFSFALANKDKSFKEKIVDSKVKYILDLKNTRIVGERYTTHTLYWSKVALIVKTFSSLLHYTAWQTESIGGLSPKKYGDKITSDSNNSLFYPKKFGSNSSIFFCTTDSDILDGNKILSDATGNEILPIAYSIRFLYTVAMLYESNSIKILSDAILNGVEIPGITGNSVNVELQDMFGFSKPKDMIMRLKSPSNLCQNNEYLSAYIKNAVLLYLVFMYINAGKKLNVKQEDYVVTEDDIHLMVRTLRTEADWKIIKDIFESQKDSLAEVFSKSQDIMKSSPIDIKIGTSSSTTVENTAVLDDKEVEQHLYEFMVAASPDLELTKLEIQESTEDISTYENTKLGRLQLATKITQDMFKKHGVNVNTTAASVIANAVLTYPTLFEGNKSDVYDVVSKTKLDSNTFKTLDDINKNFPGLLTSALFLEENMETFKALLKMTPEHARLSGKNYQETIKFAHIEVQKGSNITNEISKLTKNTPLDYSNLNTMFKGSSLTDYYKNVEPSDILIDVDNKPEVPKGTDFLDDKNSKTDQNPQDKPDQDKADVGAINGDIKIKHYDLQPGDVDVNAMLESSLINVKDGWVRSDNPEVQYFLNKESYGGKIEANKITDDKGNIINKTKARGLFQFTPGTWNYITGGKDFDLAFDANENFKAFKKLLMENIDSLKAKNIPLTRFNLYMAHQQGISGIKNIHDIASGKLTEGEVFDRTMLNIKSNLKQSLKSKQDSLSSQRLASEFLKSWNADADGKVYVFQNAQTPTPKSEVSDVVTREEPGITESLFISPATDDSIDGLINSVYYM